MGKYLLAYEGGLTAETGAEQRDVTTRWMAWFGSLGEALVDRGHPYGSVDARTGGPVPALTGYSIISADSRSAACDLAQGCPVLGRGGTVEVYEVAPLTIR